MSCSLSWVELATYWFSYISSKSVLEESVFVLCCYSCHHGFGGSCSTYSSYMDALEFIRCAMVHQISRLSATE